MGPRASARGNADDARGAIAHRTASMGPRASARGNTPRESASSPASLLQWGRARPHAEIPILRGELHLVFQASMGPRASARGNVSCGDGHSYGISVLQWGRARPHAEINVPVGLQTRGFTLQWGRARPQAEMRVFQHRRRQPQVASMGPRASARGNHARRAGGCVRPGRLQWGRARPHAEIDVGSVGGMIVDGASMGPRASARGNSVRGRLSSLSDRSFNGAARVRTQKSNPWRNSATAPRSFNGAARVRTRK